MGKAASEYRSPIMAAIHETADDLNTAGLIEQAIHAQV